MNCQRAEGLFSAFREEELPLTEKNALAQHFESCAGCKRDYEEFVHTLDLMHSLPRLEAPTDFTDKVLARVRSGAPVHADPWWQRVIWQVTDWSDSLSLKPAYAAAAAVLVVAVATVVVFSVPDRDDAGVTEQLVADAEQSEQPQTDDVSREEPEAPLPAEVEGEATDVAVRDETSEPLPERVDNDLYPVVPDSLFDHEYDFEFALDRFYFERLPDESGAGQMHPLPGTQGRPASITF
jgi:hypothetical protein